MRRPTLSGDIRLRLRLRQKPKLIAVASLLLLAVTSLVIYFHLASVKPVFAASSGDYRTRASGNWNGTSVWQKYSSGSWSNVSTSPTSSDGAITILSGHTVTITAAVTVDEVDINAGGEVDLNSGVTLTVANGSGTDFDVSGIYKSAGTTTTTGATVAFQSGSTYIHNQNGGTVLTATWNASSNCRIIGVTTTYPSGMGQTFGHVTFNSALTADVEMTSNLTAAGNLNISGTGTKILYLTNSASNRTITVGGNLNDSAGTFVNVNSSGTGNITVSGNLTMAGGSFTNANGTVTGTVSVSGSVTQNSGTYINSGNSGTGTMAVTGSLSVSNGTFTNVNSSGTGTMTVSGSLTVSNGTFTNVNNSGNGTVTVSTNFNLSGGTFNLKNGAGTAALNVTGNEGITGGAFNTRPANTAGTATITVTGNFSMSAGTFDLAGVAATGTLNVAGNFSHTAGTITAGGSGAGSIAFTKSGSQTYTSGGTVSNAVNYTVNSGSTLVMGTSLLGNGSSGTFTLSSGAGLSVGDVAGITGSASTGNIRVTGARSFSAGANYTYAGSSAQVTGDGLPSSVNNLTINNSTGVTLTNGVAVSGTLTLTSGKITTGANEVNITNTSTSAVTGYSSSSYINGKLRRSNGSSGTYPFPVGTSAQYELMSLALSGVTGPSNILVTFTNATPLSVLQPLANQLLNGNDITDMLNYGYWTMTPNLPILLGSYNVTLYERGYTNAPNSSNFTVLSRITSLLPWLTEGNSVSGFASGGTVTTTRSGLSLGYDFGIGIAHNSMSMVFKNSSLISGTDGQVNATYKFPSATTGIDAWIKIISIVGGAYLSGIDNFSGGNGYDIAWQPYVNGAGNDTSYIEWKIMFKKAGTSTDTILTNVAITGIDIDGDGGGTMREFVEATWPYSYSLDTSSILTVLSVDSNYMAVGDYATIANIDTAHTEAMYQINYSSVSYFYYRTGTISTKSAAEVRQHALMFNSTLTNNTTTTTQLPITLTSFNVRPLSGAIEISWSTANEINNNYFTIERSSNGKDFEEILRKPGAGNSTSTRYYSATDPSPLRGTGYYRLKQTDYDGKFEYFPMKAVRFAATPGNENISIKNVGPNPFTDNFNISYSTIEAGEVEMQIVNFSGQLLYKETLIADKGINDYSYADKLSLPPGIYIISIGNGEDVVTQKIIKQ